MADFGPKCFTNNILCMQSLDDIRHDSLHSGDFLCFLGRTPGNTSFRHPDALTRAPGETGNTVSQSVSQERERETHRYDAPSPPRTWGQMFRLWIHFRQFDAPPSPAARRARPRRAPAVASTAGSRAEPPAACTRV
eukprot:gene7342-biopygen9072